MDKTALVKALKLCLPAIGKNLMPGLDEFHFSGRFISAFNGALLVRAELEEELPINGSIIGNNLYNLINSLDSIDINLSVEDNVLTVRSGRSRTKFTIDKVDSLLLEDHTEEKHGTTYLPTNMLFAAGLKRCLATIGGKGVPQIEIGEHVFIDTPSSGDSPSECRIYSTNGSQFSRFICPLPNQMSLNQVFLPASFCENLVAIYGEMGVEPSEIAITEKYVRAMFPNVVLRHSFYANPVSWDIRGLVDQGIDNVTTLDIPEVLDKAIKRCEVIAEDSTITIEYGDKLLVKAVGRNNQDIVEEIDFLYPTSGSIDVELKGLRKKLETCKDIGFGEDYMVLVGKEDCYDLVITTKVRDDD